MDVKNKKVLEALEMAKAEIIAALPKQRGGRRKVDRSPLTGHFEKLAVLLADSDDPPPDKKIVTVVVSLVEELEKLEGLPDGLLDILPPQGRRSVILLFLYQVLHDIDKKNSSVKDFPTKVPLEVSEGDDIKEEDLAAHAYRPGKNPL